MVKFRKASIILRDEHSGKVLQLSAQPFTFTEFVAPRSGVYLVAVVRWDDARVGQSAVVMTHRISDEEDAGSTARVMMSEFLEILASVLETERSSAPTTSEWRAFIQSRTNSLYHAAQQKTFPLDILEVAEQFGQYCALLRFVYLYFLSTNPDVFRCAEKLRSIAASLLDGGRQRSVVVSL